MEYRPPPSTDDPQSRVLRFVTQLAGVRGFEQYWVQIHGDSFNRAEKETILRYCIPPRTQAVVLDAGCGEGRLTFRLAQSYRQVYALDVSQQSCKELQRSAHARGLSNIIAWSQDLLDPLALRHLDTITLVQVLQHFDKIPERIRVLRNLGECLAVGGKILVTVFNHDRIWNKLRGLVSEVDKASGYPYFHYFTAQELRSLLSAAGFGNIEIRGCITFPAFLHQRRTGDLVSKLDVSLSAFPSSRYLGIYLLATAERME